MRASDLLRTAFTTLWQQKARTFLTVFGVLIGTCSLTFSMSLGVGLRAMIDHEFQKRAEFWWVRVYAGERGTAVESDDDIPPEEIRVDAKISPERAVGIREALIENYRRSHVPKNLKLVTPEILEKIRSLPDVDDIRITQQSYGHVILDGRVGHGLLITAPLDVMDPPLDRRITHGRMPSASGEIVVSEFALYRWGVRTDDELKAVLGRPLNVTLGESDQSRGAALSGILGSRQELKSLQHIALFQKLLQQLPDKLDTFDLTPNEVVTVQDLLKSNKPAEAPDTARGTYTIVGIAKPILKADRSQGFKPDRVIDGNFYDVYLTTTDAPALFGQLKSFRERGLTDVNIHVRPHGDLRGTVNALKEMNLNVFSTVDWYESAKLEVTMISVGLNVFSLVALVIAAIGITNTLVTSVLERTREIGIVKAIGATDRIVVNLFLAEGAAIGLIGSVLGVIVARLIANPADHFVKSIVKSVSRQKILSESVFEFPAWLWISVIVFAVVVTTLSAWYPARRAARIEPVEALRHE